MFSDATADTRSVVLRAVRAAAALCQTVQADIDNTVATKDDRSPVTVADFGSQALICHALQQAFPDTPVIAEEDSTMLQTEEQANILQQVVARVQEHEPAATAESVCRWIDHGNADRYHDRFWTLDPIDGTKGFVRGDQYAIALALVENGVPTVAALGCPNLPDNLDEPTSHGQVFIAVRDEGAMQFPLDDPNADGTPIHTRDTAQAEEARFCDSFVSAHSAHDKAKEVGDMLGISAPPIRVDSQAKYAIVARGDTDIYFRLPRPGSDYTEKIWDHAAGRLVVEAAGGRVSDMHGEPLDFTHAPLLSENTGVVATSGAIHNDVIQALADYER
jgi:3'(2'), 5'-bisphosphate nucleotidase